MPVGGGGYVIAIDMPNGLAAGAIVTTDVNGAFRWNNATQKFEQLFTLNQLGYKAQPGTDTGTGLGCVQAPSEPTTLYALYWNKFYSGNFQDDYRFYSNVNSGGWQPSNYTFTADPHVVQLGIAGEVAPKFSGPRIAVDPINPNVVYVGALAGGGWSTNGAIRTANGKLGTGMTMTWVSGVPEPTTIMGTVGICFDKSSGTATPSWCSPQTVTKRILMGVAGWGLYESNDGGDTWARKTSDPTPSTSCSYTTTQTDAYIVIQIWNYGLSVFKGITNTGGPSTLTWVKRGGPIANVYSNGNMYEYYAKAPVAGTYTWTVDYYDGAEDYLSTTPAAASCTLGNVTGSVLTVDASSTGTWAVGNTVESPPYTHSGVYITSLGTGSGGAGTYNLNVKQPLPFARTVTSRPRIANQVGVFAITGADQTTPFPSAASYNSITQVGLLRPMVLTPGITYLGFTMTFSAYASADTGYTRIGYSDTNLTRFAEITTSAYQGTSASFTATSSGTNLTVSAVTGTIAIGSVLAGTGIPAATPGVPYTSIVSQTSGTPGGAGVYVTSQSTSCSGAAITSTPALFGNSVSAANNAGSGFITDAIAQASGGTLAFDGTPVAFTSASSQRLQPVNITHAQINASGDYWFVDGATAHSWGSVWRYLNGGTIEQVDGYGVGSDSFTGWAPNFITNLQATITTVCLDPRAGHEGNVIIQGNDGIFRGRQTSNGNAASRDLITWKGSASGGSLVSHIDSPVIGWIGNSTTTGSNSAFGDMRVDVTDGTYLQAYGSGVLRYLNTPQPLNLDSGNFQVYATQATEGIDEMLIQDFLAAPGSPVTLIACEDQEILQTYLYQFPYGKQPGGDSDCWGLDFAANNPNYIAAYITGQVDANKSCYSTDAGLTWTLFSTLPPYTKLGGCLAVGSYTSPTVANVVIIPGTDQGVAVTPIYTTDNGQTWHTSTAPTAAYTQSKESPYRGVAADRVNAGTFLLYVPGTGAGTGIYRSTDNGATFAAASPGLTGFGAASRVFLHSVPGNAGHFWLVANAGSLRYTTDAGNNWTAVSGVSGVQCLALGKIASGKTYPTIFIYGIVTGQNAGAIGYFRSEDQGATWILFGADSDVPGNQSQAALGMIQGDWNVAGRCYMQYASSGAAYYNP